MIGRRSGRKREHVHRRVALPSCDAGSDGLSPRSAVMARMATVIAHKVAILPADQGPSSTGIGCDSPSLTWLRRAIRLFPPAAFRSQGECRAGRRQPGSRA